MIILKVQMVTIFRQMEEVFWELLLIKEMIKENQFT